MLGHVDAILWIFVWHFLPLCRCFLCIYFLRLKVCFVNLMPLVCATGLALAVAFRACRQFSWSVWWLVTQTVRAACRACVCNCVKPACMRLASGIKSVQVIIITLFRIESRLRCGMDTCIKMKAAWCGPNLGPAFLKTLNCRVGVHLWSTCMLDKIVDEHCYRTLVLLGVRVPIFVHALGPPLLLLSVQEGHVTLYTRATGLGSPLWLCNGALRQVRFQDSVHCHQPGWRLRSTIAPVAMSRVRKVPLCAQNLLWHRKAQSCSLQVDDVDMILGLNWQLLFLSLNLRLAGEKVLYINN